MASSHTSANELRDGALLLAQELGVDSGADLGALVRVYWELQRLTGRADLRDTWRSLADQLWSGEAA